MMVELVRPVHSVTVPNFCICHLPIGAAQVTRILVAIVGELRVINRKRNRSTWGSMTRVFVKLVMIGAIDNGRKRVAFSAIGDTRTIYAVKRHTIRQSAISRRLSETGIARQVATFGRDELVPL